MKKGLSSGAIFAIGEAIVLGSAIVWFFLFTIIRLTLNFLSYGASNPVTSNVLAGVQFGGPIILVLFGWIIPMVIALSKKDKIN